MSPEPATPLLACTAPFGFSEDPARVLAAFASLGCRSCQYYRKVDDPLDAARRRASVNESASLRVAADARLRFDSIHGVFSEHINPSSPDLDHRRLCWTIYEDEARLARSLGGSMVVVHPASLNPGKRWLAPREAAAAQAVATPCLSDFLLGLADVGERLDTTFLIENLPFSCSCGFDPVLLAASIRAAGSSRIRMCLDTGHAHCTVATAACTSADSVADAVAACSDVIEYFHIHDNHADADSHLIPGEGSIDWNAVSRSLAPPTAARMLELFHSAAVLSSLAESGLRTKLAAWLHTPP